MFELCEPRRLNQQQEQSLSEAVGNVPFGTIIEWPVAGTRIIGVVTGRKGNDVLCMSFYDRALRSYKPLGKYRNDEQTKRIKTPIPGVEIGVYAVPASKAMKKGILIGAALKPYVDAAAHIQLESEECHHKQALKEGEEQMNFAGIAEKLGQLNAIMEADELTERRYKLKKGAARTKAHKAFLKMVKKDPAAHRRKMRMDREYHKHHKAHDRMMRKTAKKGFVRR